MSASNKKKLRKALENAQLTEKQLKQNKEDKKTKILTIGFIALMCLIVVGAAAIFVTQLIGRSGVFEKNTVEMTVGEHKINTVELGYYFKDTIDQQYSEWSETYQDYASFYLQAMGLDLSKSLNKQTYDEESGQTWADYFLDIAKNKAKTNYALYDEAMKQGFKLSDEATEQIDNMINNLPLYAQLSGLSDASAYLRSYYGNGAEPDSFKNYNIVTRTAQEFYQNHQDSLTYDAEAIRAYDKEHTLDFNSYDYASYYISYTSFQQGGTEDAEGNKTYSDAEKDAARAAAKAAAEKLTTATNVEELNAAIAELDLDSKECTENKGRLYSELDGTFRDWLTDGARKANDITMIENKSTTTGEDGKEVTNINGYYVILFLGATDNATTMGNVRHILINFETEGEDSDPTDEQKAAAKKKAEELLETWKKGNATEASFIELVHDNTGDTATAETGGLYENVNPNSGFYEEFQNWALDASRKAGDTGIVESGYGYHIMYYVGAAELNYRDYMISNELRTADQKAWSDGLTEAITVVNGTKSRLNKDIVLGN